MTMASPAPAANPLHSDHVNYLIWRYLQERGYGRTAVQLMRDWNGEPSRLPFAQDVKPRELISIIQDGIMFDDLASKVQSRDRSYQFILDKKRKTPPDSQPGAPDSIHVRKRPRNENRGSARNRNVPHMDGDAMEIDQTAGSPMQLDVNDTDSKTEEPLALVSTLSAGESTGVQQPPHARTVALLQLPDAEVLDVSWSLEDEPELFATGGSLWRSWKLGSHVSSPDEIFDEPPHIDHAPTDGVFSVSASSRHPRNQMQASAFADKHGSVVVLDGQGGTTQHRMVTSYDGTTTLLRWDNDGKWLLVVSQNNKTNEVSVWEAKDCTCLAFIDTSHVVEDATWAHGDQFILCGDGFLLLHKLPAKDAEGKVLDQGMEPFKSIPTSMLWAYVKYDPHTKRAACVAPDDGELAIVGIDDFTFQTRAVHPGQITAIEWDDSIQDNSNWEASKTRLLVSSSTNGSIKIWNAYSSLECLFSLNMGGEVPAMTLAAQKEYIAAAGDGQISIWKLRWPENAGGSPQVEEVAVWHALSESKEAAERRLGWPVDEAPFHKIAWQPQNNLLAYSAGNEIHVVKVP